MLFKSVHHDLSHSNNIFLEPGWYIFINYVLNNNFYGSVAKFKDSRNYALSSVQPHMFIKGFKNALQVLFSARKKIADGKNSDMLEEKKNHTFFFHIRFLFSLAEGSTQIAFAF